MDRQMPGMDGLETTRRIREDRNIHQPRIISFSAYVDEKDREDAFDAGMDGVIEKPVTIEQLRRFIEEPPGS
jgi:two-component system, sensor histidine kinase and response regulator